jgi:hypothetical protein
MPTPRLEDANMIAEALLSLYTSHGKTKEKSGGPRRRKQNRAPGILMQGSVHSQFISKSKRGMGM